MAAEILLQRGAHDLEIRGDPAGTELKMAEPFQGRALFVSERAVGLPGLRGPGAPDPLALDNTILASRLDMIARLDVVQDLDLLEDFNVINELDELPGPSKS